jgi:hypothetical protein
MEEVQVDLNSAKIVPRMTIAVSPPAHSISGLHLFCIVQLRYVLAQCCKGLCMPGLPIFMQGNVGPGCICQ